MKKIITIITIACLGCDSSEIIPAQFYDCVQANPITVNATEAASYQAHIDQLVNRGIPGIILAIDHPEKGFWVGASGQADIASKVTMKSCNISRAGSIAKTFTATSVLLLIQDGKLSLDDKAMAYLPSGTVGKLKNADQATIRQLLNHTSGIYNYIQDAKFQTASLNDLARVWQPEDLLSYAYGRDAYFAVGKGCQYSNTNYILLGMIIEKVSGLHFSLFFKQRIFDPFGLTFTSFNINDPIPKGLARGYIDLYSNGEITEATHFSGWDYYTADGGLISNSQDLAKFIKLLQEGKILSTESLKEMQTVVPLPENSDFFKTFCGLGIFRAETDYGTAYFHSGDAIGYYGNMMYFSDSGVSIAWQTNGNYGTLDKLFSSKEAFQGFMELAHQKH
jgi:D-alanyl-D-alanine carboxypeptidase